MTQTHSFSILTVSRATFDEIHQRMLAAGWEDQVQGRGGDDADLLLDMNGLALQVGE